MKKLLKIFGYTWAALSLPIVLATFMGMNFWAKTLADVTGIEISPWFTGGEVARAIEQPEYTTVVHRPVFAALIGERSEGFVQIGWEPVAEGTLPGMIQDSIDLDRDGQPDFSITLDTVTNEVTLNKHNDDVLGVGQVLNLGKSRAVRIILRNPNR